MVTSARHGVHEYDISGSSLLTHGPRNRPDRLAEKLLQIRKALGLHQKEMAERLAERTGFKIPYKNISKYERGRSVPFIEIVLAYARVASVEMNQIVDDDLDLAL